MIRETLTQLFTVNHRALHTNVEGITDREALVRPQPDGNCLNWVVGHIVASRNGALKLVGEEPIWDAATADRYKRGSAPISSAEEGKPLAALLADLDASQERLLRGIGKAADGKWEEALPDWGTVGRAIFFLHFHEAYHIGQTGLLRRVAGKPGAIR